MASIDRLVRVKNELLRFMLCEFYGTFLLVFIAHSTGAAYGFYSSGSDKVAKVFAATFGIGVAALVALTTAMPVSGGHINPAITVAVATMGHFPWKRVIPYLIAQHLGGFAAGAAIYLTFYDPIQNTINKSGRDSKDGWHKTAHLFCSSEASGSSTFGSFLGSFVATAVFLIGIAAILDQRSHMKPPKWYWPLGVAFVLMISLAPFGVNGGPSVNPAADLPTRIFASMLGWGGVLWHGHGGHYWWIGGLAGPHLGAIFGLWSYRLMIGAHYPDEEEETEANRLEMERLNKA